MSTKQDEKRIIILFMAFLLMCARHGFADPVVYVTNSAKNKLSVIDAGSQRVVKEIRVGNEPFGLAFSPDGRLAYVANAKSPSVSVLDASRHRVLREIPLGTRLPVWVAVCPDGSFVYATNEGSHNVSVIATASNIEVGRISVGRAPAGIVVSPDGRRAYVANEGSHDVSVIDLQRAEVIQTIGVGSVPQGLAVTADGARVYVANFGGNSVSVIETSSNRVVAEIPVDPKAVDHGPAGIAVSPDASRVYTGNFKTGSLSILNAVTREPVATVPLGPETFGIAADPRGGVVYATSGKQGRLFIIDAATYEVTGSVQVGEGAFKPAVMPEPASKHRLRELASLLPMGFLALVLFLLDGQLRSRMGWLLAAIFFVALSLRLAGLDWGIPHYDAGTAQAAPEMRGSFHMDEDNFLRNLTRVRPRALDFYVADFHWGTLQYYLVEIALLLAQAVGFVSRPWRDSFVNFHPDEFGRLFVTGRAVSALLGSCSVIVAYGIGKKLYDARAGIWAALILSVLPLHVVNSHFLTSDISMVFFLLLAFYGLMLALERPGRCIYFLAGAAFGLAVTAKYNAVFLLPAILVALLRQRESTWSMKAWALAGAGTGFLLGEPYALAHRAEFWETLKRTYQATAGVPPGAVPSTPELAALQLKNMALFGIGIPLALALLLLILVISWLALFSRRLSWSDLRNRFEMRAFTSTKSVVLWAALLSFFISVLCLRQPMIRYTLPVVALAVFPISHILSLCALRTRGKLLAGCLLLATAFFSCLQIGILAREHTANRAFRWVEQHVPVGASVTKGWPEIPVLNPEKYRIRNYYTGNRMVDFRDFFQKADGQPDFPDYVLLDNLATFVIPEEFMRQLHSNYHVVARLKSEPQFLGFSFPEWDAPHDWKYSHPEITIYRRKVEL